MARDCARRSSSLRRPAGAVISFVGRVLVGLLAGGTPFPRMLHPEALLWRMPPVRLSRSSTTSAQETEPTPEVLTAVRAVLVELWRRVTDLRMWVSETAASSLPASVSRLPIAPLGAVPTRETVSRLVARETRPRMIGARLVISRVACPEKKGDGEGVYYAEDGEQSLAWTDVITGTGRKL